MLQTLHRRFARSITGLALSGVSLLGCANGPNLSLDYGQTARENYELAVTEFDDRDWEDTVSYANFVRARFPFSRYAVESELLVARAEFAMGNYMAAGAAFRQFARLHPTHQNSRNGWSSYMVAVAAYMSSPGNSVFLPAHFELDQSQLTVCLDELGYFFDHYPQSPMIERAAKLRADAQGKLMEHELYVAEFYLGRDRPYSAVARLEAAHRRYPSIGYDAQVLFLLGVTYLRMDEVEKARNTFTELQSQHPKHYNGKQARIYLTHIYDVYGAADPNRNRPEYAPPLPKKPIRPKKVETQSTQAAASK